MPFRILIWRLRICSLRRAGHLGQLLVWPAQARGPAVNQMIRNATEATMARPGFCRGFVDSSPTTAAASQPAYRTAQVTPALATPRMPPMLLPKEKSDHEGRLAPPAWLASWIAAEADGVRPETGTRHHDR